MADLEHDVPNAPDTIFEAGSVSKQFTAAAVLLLAQDGKLSLDDPVRKYIPSCPTTARRSRSATCCSTRAGCATGARSPASPAGRGRSRVHTHAHVLDIVSRQKALNFPPGTQWSYSNTGYNLAAIIVSRVSGKSFAEFSQRAHLRAARHDAHLVARRLHAHRQGPRDRLRAGGRRLPHGHAVRERARQRRAADDRRRSAEVERELRHAEGRRRGVREDAAGARAGSTTASRTTTRSVCTVGPTRACREVSHSGSTAGYRAHLTRFPEQHVSVAVLCNVSSGNATQYAQTVAEMYLGDAIKAMTTTARCASARERKPASLPIRRTWPHTPAATTATRPRSLYEIALDGQTSCSNAGRTPPCRLQADCT